MSEERHHAKQQAAQDALEEHIDEAFDDGWAEALDKMKEWTKHQRVLLSRKSLLEFISELRL